MLIILMFILLFTGMLFYGLFTSVWSIIYKIKIDNLVENICTKDDLQDICFKDFPHVAAEIFKRKGYRVKLTDKCGEEGNGLILDDLQFVEVWKHALYNVVEMETAMKLAKRMQMESIYRGMLITLGDFKQNTRLFCHKYVITCINGDEFLNLCKTVQKRKGVLQTD